MSIIRYFCLMVLKDRVKKINSQVMHLKNRRMSKEKSIEKYFF